MSDTCAKGGYLYDRTTPDGRATQTCWYAQDVGNLHVIDYRLWLADLPIRRLGVSPRSLHFTDNWTRP